MRAVVALLTLLLLPAALAAELLHFDFSGFVTGMPTGLFAGAAAGESVSGYYRYDSALAVSPGANPAESSSWFGFANPSRVWEFEIRVGGVTRRTSGVPAGGISPWPFLALTDAPASDAFSLIVGQVGSENDDQATLSLSDSTPLPPDGVAPGSGSLTAAIPTLPPDPTLFDTSSCSYIARELTGAELGALSFELTSVSVPAALPSLGFRGFALLVAALCGAALLATRRSAPVAETSAS